MHVYVGPFIFTEEARSSRTLAKMEKLYKSPYMEVFDLCQEKRITNTKTRTDIQNWFPTHNIRFQITRQLEGMYLQN